jgi:hypothetical protein
VGAASAGLSGGAVAGIVIGVLAAVGIAVGAYMHFKNKAKASSLLAKQDADETGFDDENM